MCCHQKHAGSHMVRRQTIIVCKPSASPCVIQQGIECGFRIGFYRDHRHLRAWIKSMVSAWECQATVIVTNFQNQEIGTLIKCAKFVQPRPLLVSHTPNT
jgi:hypothetical protein